MSTCGDQASREGIRADDEPHCSLPGGHWGEHSAASMVWTNYRAERGEDIARRLRLGDEWSFMEWFFDWHKQDA